MRGRRDPAIQFPVLRTKRAVADAVLVEEACTQPHDLVVDGSLFENRALFINDAFSHLRLLN